MEEVTKLAYRYIIQEYGLRDLGGELTEVGRLDHVIERAFIAGYVAASPKWVSVEEELPREGVCVFINGFSDQLGYIDTLGWCDLEMNNGVKVTHWLKFDMPPIPEKGK